MKIGDTQEYKGRVFHLVESDVARECEGCSFNHPSLGCNVPDGLQSCAGIAAIWSDTPPPELEPHDEAVHVAPEFRAAYAAQNQPVRSFTTGATRSNDAGRYDPEGYLSPIVIERFAQYMQKHQVQPDGTIRSSDNWQKGIPVDTYMKGLQRHTLHAWTRHRGFIVQDSMANATLEEDLCSIIFNASGMLFELLKKDPAINPGAVASHE